ncbi:MAG: ATP-binding protein [Pirellulales bacterium]
MAGTRLLGQLLFEFLAVVALSVLLAGFFSWRALQDSNRQLLLAELHTQALLIEERLEPLLVAGDQAALREQAEHVAKLLGSKVQVRGANGELLFDSQASRQPASAVAPSPPPAAAAPSDRVVYDPRERAWLAWASLPIRADQRVLGEVRVGRPLTPLEETLRRVVWQTLGSGLLAALVAVLLARHVGNRLRRPLAALRGGAEQMASGDLTTAIPEPDLDELADVARSLNQMAGRLSSRLGLLERQNAEQAAVLASMAEGVVAIDSQERIISLNKAAAALLGAGQIEAQGRGLQEVIRNTELRRIAANALAGATPLEGDVLLHPDRSCLLQVQGAALRNARGQAIGAVIVLNDVTRLRRLESMRRDFVANVSHELKTPITSIKGFVETLLDGAIENPQDAERFLRIIAQQSDRLNAIIEDLLSLSKIEQGEEASDIALDWGPIREVLEAAARECRVKSEERQIDVLVECEPSLRARINAPLLEQAVINLLDNALKYSEPGRQVQVLGERTANAVVISVRDQGCGISAEHLPRVFERFYRVDKARSRKLGGTGLGLAIVKHIAQAHHGRVTVASSPGRGSSFSIQLPLA